MMRIENKSNSLGLIFGRGKDASEGGEYFFDEPAFKEMLNLERKRSQRSMKNLILMRLDISGLMKPNLAYARSKLLKALATGIRDSDVRGWYKRESTIGILFTDIESASPSVQAILFHRVMARLVSQFDPSPLLKIKVTLFIYPGGRTHGDAVDHFEIDYHKNFVKKRVKFNLSAKIKSLVDEASNFLVT